MNTKYTYHFSLMVQVPSSGTVRHMDGVIEVDSLIRSEQDYEKLKEKIRVSKGLYETASLVVSSLSLLTPPASAPLRLVDLGQERPGTMAPC